VDRFFSGIAFAANSGFRAATNTEKP